MVKIRQDYVQGGSDQYPGKNPCLFITVHETGNTSPGADAAAHARLQKNAKHDDRSWHATADEDEVVESYPDDVMCFHAGDGRKGPGLDSGNEISLAIELCQVGDFRKVVDNAAQWVAGKMRKHNIPLSRVVQHNHWSGKNCPRWIRTNAKGINWDDFRALVAHYYDGTAPSKPSKPSKPTTKPSKGFDMASLPIVTVKNTRKKSDDIGRIQGLLKAAGHNLEVDDVPGPVTEREFHRFQAKHGCGDSKGNPDNICGGKSWESLLTGKRW